MKEFYLPTLDGIRACAFLLVFMAHAGLDKVVPGGLGVTVFFFLSGYLITTLLRKEFASTSQVSLKNFYIRRSLRILPPMYVTLGLACLVAIVLPAVGGQTSLGILSALTYFYNYADLLHNSTARLPAGIGLFWSLMIEEHFYLLFPIVYLQLLRSRFTRNQQGIFLGAVCLAALLWRCVLVLVLHTPLTTLPRWTYSSTDARFDSILWGAILAIVWNPVFGDGSPTLERNAGKLAWAGALLMGATLAFRNPVFRETFRYSLQSIALLPIFYFCIVRPDASANRVLQASILRWIGWLSYSLYLIHFFLFDVVKSLVHTNRIITAAVVFTLAVVYALAIRYLIEQPSRKLQKILTRPKAVLSGAGFSEVPATGD